MPEGVFGHGGSEQKNRPATCVSKIVFTTISFITRASDVAATIVNATLDFDANARDGMSKI